MGRSTLVRLRWTRIATLAAVLLLHLGFLAFLLAPPPSWRRPVETTSAPPDALLVRLLPVRTESAVPSRSAVPRPPRPARTVPPARRPAPVALAVRSTRQAPPTPQRAPRAVDSLITTAPPDFIAGGGRLSGPAYGQQNVRVPGSDAPIRGMPVFRMADPRMQGLAGVIRVIGRATGAVDPHCLQVSAWSGMSPRERIAQHVDADDAQMAAIAARYGCPDPLKPGAAMYYFYRQRRDVGAH
ncbi:MAG TPA: hypothetical protein VJR95_07615 [Rhodanobacter sp.]|nr:hypothetical protein [Rhodanobacter sp.]